MEPENTEPKDEKVASNGHSKDHADRVFDADFFDPQEEPEEALDEDQWDDDDDEAKWENADEVEAYEDDAEAA